VLKLDSINGCNLENPFQSNISMISLAISMYTQTSNVKSPGFLGFNVIMPARTALEDRQPFVLFLASAKTSF